MFITLGSEQGGLTRYGPLLKDCTKLKMIDLGLASRFKRSALAALARHRKLFQFTASFEHLK